MRPSRLFSINAAMIPKGPSSPPARHPRPALLYGLRIIAPMMPQTIRTATSSILVNDTFLINEWRREEGLLKSSRVRQRAPSAGKSKLAVDVKLLGCSLVGNRIIEKNVGRPARNKKTHQKSPAAFLA